MVQLLNRLVSVKRSELRMLLWSFGYFFSLLSCYFILRPLRDTMGIAGGIGNLPWLFTATFLAMLAVVPLYGWLVSKFRRDQFIPYVYGFFILNLALFWWSLSSGFVIDLAAKIFFVWLSVFNVFVISVFWSFMIDVWQAEQSKRLFGFIAAGGTTGTIIGPALTAAISGTIGYEALFLISASLLMVATLCVLKINRLSHNQAEHASQRPTQETALHGSMLAGIWEVFQSPYLRKIAAFIILLSLTATIAYFQQGALISSAFESNDQRTQVFALVDLSVSVLTLILQVFVVGRLMTFKGLGFTLIILPIITSFGFVLLAIDPTLLVLAGFQIFRRAAEYGTFAPARENLFSPLSREEKYKAKNVIDTVIFRGSDVAGGWLYNLMGSIIGLGMASISLVGAALAFLWIGLGWNLGKHHDHHSKKEQDND